MNFLWEKLTRTEPIEFQYENPIKARIGSGFSLNDIIFSLKQIDVYRRVGSSFVDYLLIDLDKKEEVRVRFMPVENPDAHFTHNIVALSQYDKMKFNEDLDKALHDDTGELVIGYDDIEEKYYRLNDTRKSYDVEVISITNKVVKSGVEYWDFSRIITDEAGQKSIQYLFVELDKDSGIQTMWRGEEINAQDINMI